MVLVRHIETCKVEHLVLPDDLMTFHKASAHSRLQSIVEAQRLDESSTCNSFKLSHRSRTRASESYGAHGIVALSAEV